MAIKKEENVPFKEIKYYPMVKSFIDQKLNCCSFLFKLPVKLKDLKIFAVNSDTHTVNNDTAFENYSQKRAFTKERRREHT